MTAERLQELLAQIRGTSVAVFGDFCLDAYWMLDPSLAEPSVETGKTTRPVRRQYASLGGAGNIVANLVDLGVGRVLAVGVVGDDLFGRELVRLLAGLRVDVGGVVTQGPEWITPVYGKPYVGDDEQERLDFGPANRMAVATEEAVVAALEAALPQVQAVILNQQLPHGVNTERVLEGLNRLVAAWPGRVFLVDSRHCSERYRGALLRFNGHEAARLCGRPKPRDQMVLLAEVREFAGQIAARTGQPVFVSRGDRGSVLRAGGQTHEIPALHIVNPTDPVGAGDTSVSAIAAALATGATPLEAAELGNFASAVTVQKLRTTGTASPAEILAVGADPDFVYEPELADDPRLARRAPDSELELVTADLPRRGVRHVLFDFDGTISVLRQGWEPVMHDVFLRAILGPRYGSADESVFRRVSDRVAAYIDRSTGVQTLVQMEALTGMVRDFGLVPPEQVLDRFGYKRLYLAALMERVRGRIAKLERGELEAGDVTIKGAVAFLRALRARGLRLYLASGTDHEDVQREARALGVAELFDGGVYGATGDLDRDAKREVMERILCDNRLAGRELACFGDGPVEVRLGRKRGALAVGVASDEVRRFGLNPEKRRRLIRAGADAIVADFSQPAALLAALFGRGNGD
jgi:rfaE bifunctional protein kinase chain/domain